MNTGNINFKDNDVYFMEVLEDVVLINNNYSGLLVLNKDLKILCEIEIFEDLTIYSSFKSGKKILLYCPDNDCFVYLDLYTNEKKIILLKEFEDKIFSVLYSWHGNSVIVSDYGGELIEVNLEKATLNLINRNNKKFQKEDKNIQKLSEFSIYKIYETEDKAIIYFKDSQVALIDYKNDVIYIDKFEKGKYHNFDYTENYIAMISENELVIIHNKQKSIYNAEEKSFFVDGKFMSYAGCKSFFLLSTLKSKATSCKIEKIVFK